MSSTSNPPGPLNRYGPGVADAAGAGSGGVFFPSFDGALGGVVGESALAVGLHLALDLDELRVTADAEAGIEAREAVKVAELILDREEEIGVWLDAVGDG